MMSMDNKDLCKILLIVAGILLVVYFMSPTLDVSVLVAININLHNALDRIWWL